MQEVSTEQQAQPLSTQNVCVLRMETSCFWACPSPPIPSAFPRFLTASARCPLTVPSKHSLSSPQYCCYRQHHPALTSPHATAPFSPLQGQQATTASQEKRHVSSASGCNGDRDGSDESHTTEGREAPEESNIKMSCLSPPSSMLSVGR